MAKYIVDNTMTFKICSFFCFRNDKLINFQENSCFDQKCYFLNLKKYILFYFYSSDNEVKVKSLQKTTLTGNSKLSEEKNSFGDLNQWSIEPHRLASLKLNFN